MESREMRQCNNYEEEKLITTLKPASIHPSIPQACRPSSRDDEQQKKLSFSSQFGAKFANDQFFFAAAAAAARIVR
jgi:hypothetical protein